MADSKPIQSGEARDRKSCLGFLDDPMNVDEENVSNLTDYFQSMRLLKQLKIDTKGIQRVEEAQEKLIEYIWQRDKDKIGVKSVSLIDH